MRRVDMVVLAFGASEGAALGHPAGLLQEYAGLMIVMHDRLATFTCSASIFVGISTF